MEDQMKKQEWVSSRPAGEWMVELYRLPTRFGWSLKVGIKSPDGKFWVARPHHGEWEFAEHERNVQPPDAMFFDDTMLKQLRDLLNGQDTYGSVSEPDFLREVIKHRDQLITLLSVEMEHHHELAGRPNGPS